MYEKNRDLAEAMETFTRFARAGEEQAALLKEEMIQAVSKNNLLKAAVRSFALGQYRESADFFFKKRCYNLAAPQYQALGVYETAARCFYKMGDYYQAALEVEQSQAPDKWEQAAQLFSWHVGEGRSRDARKELKLLKEGELLFSEGSYDRALARFKIVRALDLIREVYRKTGRDEEALEYYLGEKRLEEARRYVEEAGGLNISPAFFQKLLSKNLGSPEWYSLESQARTFLTGLMKKLLKQEKGEEWRPCLDLLGPYSFYWGRDFPRPLLDFMVKARHYNALFETIRIGLLIPQSAPPVLKKFLPDLGQIAAEEKDPTLLACYHYSQDKDLFESDLVQLEITLWNYKLFGESTRQYHRAIDFLLAEEKAAAAVTLARHHRNYRLAGHIYEKHKAYAQAGREYREGGFHEEALRCYRAIGDEAGIARVYEKQNNLEEALKIWKRLGHRREVTRLQKKVDKK